MNDRSHDLQAPDDYLCVDDYLYDFLTSQALATALESGLIDALSDVELVTRETLAAQTGIENNGLDILLELLRIGGVIDIEDSKVWLQSEFRESLHYRDLMEIKLEMARLVSPDLLNNFSAYINNMEEFMAQAKIFKLFDYQRCYTISDDNLAATSDWVRYTSILTRYETPVCLHHFDVTGFKKMLDIGGNSGEFAIQVCETNPDIRVSVLDLPVVCELGKQHLDAHQDSKRVEFIAGDALRDTIPPGFDLVSFKSVLHDWPEAAVESLITRASECLVEGGTLLIFERCRPDSYEEFIGFGNLPLFLFVRYYRDPYVYQRMLRSQGFGDITIKIVQLEFPFMVLSARRAKNN